MNDRVKHEHVEPLTLYYRIFGALIGLTFLTVCAAFVHFGPFNTPIALLIAVVKALLVIIFFMHVRHATQLQRLFVGAGFFCLALFLVILFTDYSTRRDDVAAAMSSTWIPQDAGQFTPRPVPADAHKRPSATTEH